MVLPGLAGHAWLLRSRADSHLCVSAQAACPPGMTLLRGPQEPSSAGKSAHPGHLVTLSLSPELLWGCHLRHGNGKERTANTSWHRGRL